MLFERLAVSWTISGLEITRQKELLGRYRMATDDERRFVRDTLREHAAEHFPELAGAVIDPDAFAALLCDWCLEVRERQSVLVSTTPRAAPLLRAFHRAWIRGGWPPALRIAIPGVAEDFYRLAGDDTARQLRRRTWRTPAGRRLPRHPGAGTPGALSGVDPVLIARASRALEPVREVRMSKRWCGTIWPTPALAQHAGMSDDDYAAFVNRALFLDRPDPARPGAS